MIFLVGSGALLRQGDEAAVYSSPRVSRSFRVHGPPLWIDAN